MVSDVIERGFYDDDNIPAQQSGENGQPSATGAAAPAKSLTPEVQAKAETVVEVNSSWWECG